jgi:hypothetical protein
MTLLLIKRVTLPSLVGLIILGPPSFTEAAESRQKVLWPFFVAERSTTWIRPTPAEQQQVWDSSRFGGAHNSYQYYTQEFFLWPLGANIPYYIETWAGLSDARGTPRSEREYPAARCVPDTDPVRGAFPGAAFLGFYSLLHTVEKIEKQGNVLAIMVQPQSRGYEKVLVPWPAGASSVMLQVATPDGQPLWEQKVSVETDEKGDE